MVNQDKTKIKKQYDLFTINDKLIDSLIEKVNPAHPDKVADRIAGAIVDLAYLKNNNQYPILMEERYNSFKETIDIIYDNNNFWNELYSIQSDLNLEKYIVDKFDNFMDISNYKGKSIIFNKRCRLLIVDLFYISEIIRNNIKNINNIMGCADYSLPRYFREIGIFKYSDKLAKIVDEGIELEHNSSYEIEIRAATLYVLGQIKKELNRKKIIVSQ